MKIKLLILGIIVCIFGSVSLEKNSAQDNESFNKKKIEEISKKIAGRENQPAETVFANIQKMKGVEAGRLLRTMGLFSRALGVSCAHCHVTDQWDKDDKREKQTAREMITMTRTINGELIKNIKTLKSENPGVTCTTCHRGQLKPLTNFPEPTLKP